MLISLLSPIRSITICTTWPIKHDTSERMTSCQRTYCHKLRYEVEKHDHNVCIVCKIWRGRKKVTSVEQKLTTILCNGRPLDGQVPMSKYDTSATTCIGFPYTQTQFVKYVTDIIRPLHSIFKSIL